MKKLRDSEWKYRYISFYTRARYGRPADTIILRHAITPTGRDSKYWATCRINGERIPHPTNEQLEYYAQPEQMRLPKLPKGYKWSEPYVY